jgi:nucleotide-binding universal stress UspA family protein
MRILFATDGSPGAVEAGEFLACLPLTAEDTVILLAVSSQASPGGADGDLTRSRKALSGSAARLEEERRTGAPAEQILLAARERAADLIVLGAMGVGGVARFFIGSVAERVLRHAEAPVLVARPVRHGLRRAVVGVDTSEASVELVQTAARFPLPPETELGLVTILPSRETAYGVAPMVWTSLSGDLDALLKLSEADIAKRLRALAEVATAQGRQVTAEFLRGEPEACLVSTADSEKADLIVLGSYTGKSVNVLLGAVSERVARHAHCSVLVIRWGGGESS